MQLVGPCPSMQCILHRQTKATLTLRYVCLRNVSFCAVLTADLAKISTMGMVCTVWYVVILNILSIKLTITSARLCTALVRSKAA
jgi:hypothetical protein